MIGTIISGILGYKAAGKAAEQQQEGIKEARAYIEPKYAEAQRIAAEQLAQGRADLAPYAQAGAGGINALSQFLGVPAAAPARAAAAPPAAPASASAPSVPGPVSLASLARGATPAQLADANRVSGGAFDVLAQRAAAREAAPAATTSSYVTLRAPTGETQPVPADQAAFFLARGATQV